MKKLIKDLTLCIITGPNGAGKSSVSKALALKFRRSAVIRFGSVRKMVVGGYVEPPGSDAEGKIQVSLATKNVCMLANNFVESGFNVIIDGVTDETHFKEYSNFFRRPIKVFLLLPSLEVLLKRFRDREGVNDDLSKRTEELHRKFTSERDELFWRMIDSSEQTLEETTTQIFDELIK